MFKMKMMVAGLVVAASACAMDDGSEQSTEPAPLAEVVTDDGVVQFFELSPGSIMITQEGLRGGVDHTSTGLSAVGLYQRLAPGQGIPSALVEAQARVEIANAQNPRKISSKPPVSYANNASFQSSYCSGSWDVVHCRLDRTSNFYAQYSSVDAAHCAVSVDSGAVTARMLVEDSLHYSRDIFAGYTYWVSYDSGTWNDKVRCETINVGAGDVYDAGYRFNF